MIEAFGAGSCFDGLIDRGFVTRIEQRIPQKSFEMLLW